VSRKLRYGFTTGACAAAAARGAALLLREGKPAGCAEIDLPAGFCAEFELHAENIEGEVARAFVIKDAGDDPDVTHGVEVHARVRRISSDGVDIRAGVGVGRVTKPGLAVPVGEAAINPVPRRMITDAVREVLPEGGVEVTISIPDGEARAEQTLNARLGILGGLSILGTSGVVKPISHQAWTDTMAVAIDVAIAAGLTTLVCSTGRSSERVALQEFDLPEEGFVMMGDHVAFAAEACHRKGLPHLLVAAQFAKLVKIACGHRQTHVRHSTLDLQQLVAWGHDAGLDHAEAKQLELAHTARELFLRYGPQHPLVRRVAAQALTVLAGWAPGVSVGILLAGYDGKPAGRFGVCPD